MRFKHFINEASIFTKPGQYTYGHKVNVAVNSSKGHKLLAAITSIVGDFAGEESLTWIRPVSKSSTEHPIYRIDFGTGPDSRFFSRDDGSILAIHGSDKSIQSALIHAKGEKGSTAENAGDASEPVLSAAVVAKLIKRGANSIEDITDEDVKYVLSEALKNPNLEYTVQDKNSSIADTIKFTIMVKKPTTDFLNDPEFWNGKMGTILPSVIHYANSGQIDRYADFFYQNGKVDVIHVKSDGVSESKKRKTDIEASVNGRPLKGMNVSLKAGSPHIGQVGGGQITNPDARGYVLSNANDLFSPFGVEITPPKKITNKVKFWVDAYKQAAKQIKAMLKGTDARGEAGVVTKIANFVTHHGTSGDSNIKLVSLGTKGVSSVHSFKNLKQKMIADDIDLDCIYREGYSEKTGEARPELRVYDKNSGKNVMFIRYSSTTDGTKVWNTVEMKELLKELTTLNYIKRERNPEDIPQDRISRISAAMPAAPVAAPAAVAPTAPVAPTLTGQNVTNISGGNMVSAEQEPEEVEMESQGNWIHPHPDAVEELRTRLAKLLHTS